MTRKQVLFYGSIFVRKILIDSFFHGFVEKSGFYLALECDFMQNSPSNPPAFWQNFLAQAFSLEH
jgi:hypothetical protein